MSSGNRIELLQNLVFAASGLTFAALVLVAMQAVYVERVTKRYYALRRAVDDMRQSEDRMLQSENRDRRTKLELNMIDASRQNIDDQIRDIQGRIDKIPCTNVATYVEECSWTVFR